MDSLATGIFLSRFDAECVVDGLVRIGIDTAHISLLVSEDTRGILFTRGFVDRRPRSTNRLLGYAGADIVAASRKADRLGELSAAFSEVAGNLFIPGISLLAAGPLRNSLAIAGTRSRRCTFIEALVEMGIRESQARLYVAGLRAGGILVAASVPPACALEVQQILSSRDALGI